MSVISTITLAGLSHTDGTTAANHVFNKEANILNGIKLRDVSQADFSLAPRLSFSAKTPAGASKVIRERAQITIPYKDAVTGLVAGVITRNIEDIIPVGAPANVRKDAAATFAAMSANAVVKAMVESLDFAS